MTDETRKPFRVVTARSVTAWGGLAALATVGSIAAADTPPASDSTDDDFILLAQGAGEGDAEAAAGGEGEGEGVASLDPDTAFLSGIAFMEGHIRAGLALYEAGDIAAAQTHMGHPIEEKYDAVADRLDALGLGDLRGDIEALAAAAEEEADFGTVSALFETVRGKIEEARANFTPAQQVAGLIALTRVAGDEYTVAVAGGEVSNLHEYQDSWGFLRTIEAEAEQMAESDDPSVADVGAAILEQVAATDAAFGDIQGEGAFEMDASILYGAAPRMDIARLSLARAGEASGEGEGEGT